MRNLNETTREVEELCEAQALANYLQIELDEAESLIKDGDWLVLDDEEANDTASEYIKDSLWAFNPSFLSSFTKLPESVFTALQPLCEDSNQAIYDLIGFESFEHFCEQAIFEDGRGHFLSQYDGDEVELEGGFYGYRIN